MARLTTGNAVKDAMNTAYALEGCLYELANQACDARNPYDVWQYMNKAMSVSRLARQIEQRNRAIVDTTGDKYRVAE